MSGSGSRLNGYVTWKWLGTTLIAVVAMGGGLTSFVLEAHAATVHPNAATKAEVRALERVSAELRNVILKRLDRIEAKLDRR